MQFLYPSFLFALAALAIPIILHLFYFRRFKKVYFTNVRFLKEVKEETSARSKLRNLLVLLMRLLTILFLVLAFAQPFIPQDTEVKKGEKAVSVFLDNSFSMDALSQDVKLLEKAKQRARSIVNAYPVEDRFQVLTNDFEGRHQRLVSKEDAITLIDEVEISPAVKKLSTALTRQQQVLNSSNTENQIAYIISDFQRNITDFQSFADTTFDINLVPLQSVQEKNISIDSAWFDAPVQMLNQTNPLIVKIENLSNEAAENVRLSIRQDGQVKPVGTLSIPAKSSVIDTVNITILRTGWHEAELEITDFPIQFDDKYYFTFNVAEEINVLVINEAAADPFLNAAFTGLGSFKVDNQVSKNLNYSSFSNYQLIVTNGIKAVSSGLAFELKQYTENGGNLLVFPGINANISTYKSFLSAFPANEPQSFEQVERPVGAINTDEFIFNDVFENKNSNFKLPVTQGNYKMSTFGSRGEERLLSYRDGSSFLSKYQSGQGNLYLCAAPLNTDYNNLVRNGEIFIPMLYKMSISSGKYRPIAYTIGKDEVIQADNKINGTGTETVYKLKGKAEEFIPEQRTVSSKVFLGINGQVQDAGFYDLFLNPENVLNKYGFNYDRQESDLAYYNEEDLNAMSNSKISVISETDSQNFGTTIEERSRGVVLWRWCLILALIFLAIEVLLLRFWKV